MGDKRSALLLPAAMIVGLLAIGVRGPESTQRPGATPAAAVSVDAPEANPAEPLLKVIRQVIGVKDSSCAAFEEEVNKFDITSLVALVPDPIETRLDFEFDREIEAIRMAAAEAEYLPDRFYLPWRKAAAGASVVKLGNESDHTGVLTTQPETPLVHRSRPGILVFRRDPSPERAPRTHARSWNLHEYTRPAQPPQLLLVLLVGESPVLGPNPDALAAALRLAMTPTTKCGLQPPRLPLKRASLFVVGPRFSGSAATLGRIAGDAASSTQYAGAIRFRSGTATVRSVPHSLREGIGSQWEVDFRSMMPPDDLVLPRILEYLRNPWAANAESRDNIAKSDDCDARATNEIAVLYEATTAYGSPRQQRSCAISVPYSSNIAAYRSLSDRSGILASLADALPQAYSRSQPVLSMDGHDRAHDLPRTLSAEVANLAGLSIESSISELRRVGTSNVLLFGTSPLDLVFLANLVRRGLPNARVAGVNADMIYAHPQFAEYLTGTLLFSVYPPVAGGSILDDGEPANRLRPFSGDMAAGVHDAVVASLLEAEAGRGGEVPYETARDRLLRSTIAGPLQVWVSMVGRGALWGVAKIPIEPSSEFTWSVDGLARSAPADGGKPTSDSSCRSRRAHSEPAGTPVAFIATASIVSLAAMALSYLCGGGALPLNAGGWLRSASRGDHVARRSVLAVIVISFATLGISLATDAVHSKWFEAHCLHVLARFVWYWSATLLAWAFLKVTFVGDDAGPRPVTSARRLLIMFGSTAGVVACAGIWRFLFPDVAPCPPPEVDLEHRIRFARLSTLSSGVTPLAPAYLLASGFVVGLYSFVRRREAIARVRDGRSLVAGDKSLRPLLDDLLTSLGDPSSDAGGRYPRSWTVFWSGGVALLVSLSLIAPRWVPSVEGLLFDVALVPALMLALAWAFQSGLRFLDCWSKLSRILTALSWDWLVQAFRRLPEKVGEGLDLTLPFSERRECLRRSLQQLSMMQGQSLASSPSDRDFRTLAPSRRPAAVRLTLDAQRTVSIVDDAELRETDRELFAIGGAVLRQLRKRWQDEPSPDLRSFDEQFDWTKAESGDTLRQYMRSLDRDKRALRLAEDFVAAQFARLIGATFDQLKLLAIQAAALAVLVLLAISSYPIQPQRILLTIAILLTAFVVVTVTSAIVQQDRNEILAYLRNRNPNRIDLDSSFLTQIFSYGVIPTLTVLATAFPSLGSDIAKVMSWVGL